VTHQPRADERLKEVDVGDWQDRLKDDVERDDCLTHLLSFVQANARAAAEAAAARRQSGVDDARWWAAAGPLLARVLDPARYPRAVRVGAAAGAAAPPKPSIPRTTSSSPTPASRATAAAESALYAL